MTGQVTDRNKLDYKATECHLMAWATPSAVRWSDAVMLDGRPNKTLFCRVTVV